MAEDGSSPREEDAEAGDLSRKFGGLRRHESEARTDVTPAGGGRFEELQKKLSKMLWAGAVFRGHRRKASMLDIQDFDGAFSDIVSPAERPTWLNILTDLCVLASGIFTGYAINVYTAATPLTPNAAWIVPLLAGLIIGIVAAFLRYKKID
jgi:hypothetical protein